MKREQFITELTSYRDLFDALADDDRDLWQAMYKDDTSDTEKALREISERAAAISKTADNMRKLLQIMVHNHLNEKR